MVDETSDIIESREVFLAAISHELRAPMATLKLSAELLVDGLDTPDRQDIEQARILASVIDRQADKLVKLIAYLLDVSRSGVSSLPLELQDVDLGALVAEAAAGAQAGTSRHAIRVAAPSPVRAVVDPARIEQVLANLLDNAIKYSPSGGPILAEVTKPGPETIRITVTDAGMGIPDGEHEHMFDRFSRLHDPSVRGLGLGLYISRRLIELHGGTLTAESPPQGGTRVLAILPAIQRPLTHD
jgi:signal transduction histidine kinase